MSAGPGQKTLAGRIALVCGLLAVLVFAGCATVAPWERERLAARVEGFTYQSYDSSRIVRRAGFLGSAGAEGWL